MREMREMIVAYDSNRCIGKDNKLLWDISEDMKHFVSHTTGKVVIMGRKTFESIGKPLPYRTNIVITRDLNYKTNKDIIVYNSIDEVLENYKDFIVIGGSEIYNQFMLYVDKIYTTVIFKTYNGDSYFPEIDTERFFVSNMSELKKTNNNLTYRFVEYRLKNKYFK